MTQSAEYADPRSRTPRLALWTALLLTAAVALQRIFTTGVTVDEAYSLDTAGRSLAGTLQQATHFELQPPLYFLMLNLWLRIHESPEFARLLSLGCILVALVLLHRIGRRLGGDLLPALLPLLATLTAPVAWSAMTARGYALTLLLLVACLHGFVGIWGSDRAPERRDLPIFIGAGVAAIYTFYYSGFAVAGLVLAALLSGRRRRELAIACAVMVLAVAPLIPVVRAQAGVHPTKPEGEYGTPLTLNQLVMRTFGIVFWTGQLRHLPGMVLLLALSAALLIALAREDSPRWGRRELVCLVAALVPWLLLLVVDLLGAGLVLPRHRVVVLPPLLLLLTVLLDRFRKPVRRRVAAALAVLAFALFFLSFERNQDSFAWRAAARVIAPRRQPDEPVLVFPSDGVLPLRWELKSEDALVGIPAAPDLEHYDPAERYLRDSTMVRARVEAVVGAGESFWLVRRASLPPIAGDSLLGQYLEQSTIELGKWQVDGIDLYRLRRNAP